MSVLGQFRCVDASVSQQSFLRKRMRDKEKSEAQEASRERQISCNSEETARVALVSIGCLAPVPMRPRCRLVSMVLPGLSFQ